MLQPLLIDHAYAWSAGAHDFADHRCAGGAVLFQHTFHFLQSFGRNTEQQAATRLCVCKQKAHRRSEEHTSELQSRFDLVCRLLLEKIKTTKRNNNTFMTASNDHTIEQLI